MGQNKKLVNGNGPMASTAVVKTELPEPPREETKSKMIMDISPGKKGCSTSFPWGGHITVPPGMFNKKDNLIAKKISPSERHLHAPALAEAERLVSELYLLVARNYSFKSAMTVELPCLLEPAHQENISLRAKLAGDQTWSLIEEFQMNSKTNTVQFETKCTGMFVVTSQPRTERFLVTPQGCLYNARINRYISVRFPKKATDQTADCDIRIQQIQRQKVNQILRDFAHVCGDILAISNFYDFTFPTVEGVVNFRRGVSVKIPNTMCTDISRKEEQMETNDDDVMMVNSAAAINDIHMMTNADEESVEEESEICVMQKSQDGWKLVEQALKFTRTSLSFDVKNLGRFCIVKHKPGRAHRIKQAMPTIEDMILTLKGEIILSTSLREKSWRLLLDVVDKNTEQSIAAERAHAYWTLIGREDVQTTNEEPERGARFQHKRPLQQDQDQESKEIFLTNGCIYDLTVSGDIKILDDTPEEQLHLQYHEKLRYNSTHFDIVPVPNDKGSGLYYNGYVTVLTQSTDADTPVKTLRKFSIEYNQKQLDEFVYVDPEAAAPEPVVEVKASVVVTDTPVEETVTEKPLAMTPSMTRLTRPRQAPTRLVSKEPKVMSGRSLKVLSSAIEHGLTLAVHLNLPDSAITGLGFDSIANGLSMQDVTYKVLMLWKRTFKGTKEEQVEELMTSIKDMGRLDIAAVFMDRHRRNVELSPDCFSY